MTKKTWIVAILVLAIAMASFCGCSQEELPETVATTQATESTDPRQVDVTINWDEILTPETTVPATETTQTTEETTSQETEAPTEQTQAATEPTQTTQPTEGTTPATKPGTSATEYEWYTSLSGEAQYAFVQSFPDMPSFFEWYNAALAEYKSQNKDIIIDGDTPIDAEDLLKGSD